MREVAVSADLASAYAFGLPGGAYSAGAVFGLGFGVGSARRRRVVCFVGLSRLLLPFAALRVLRLRNKRNHLHARVLKKRPLPQYQGEQDCVHFCARCLLRAKTRRF